MANFGPQKLPGGTVPRQVENSSTFSEIMSNSLRFEKMKGYGMKHIVLQLEVWYPGKLLVNPVSHVSARYYREFTHPL